MQKQVEKRALALGRIGVRHRSTIATEYDDIEDRARELASDTWSDMVRALVGGSERTERVNELGAARSLVFWTALGAAAVVSSGNAKGKGGPHCVRLLPSVRRSSAERAFLFRPIGAHAHAHTAPRTPRARARAFGDADQLLLLYHAFVLHFPARLYLLTHQTFSFFLFHFILCLRIHRLLDNQAFTQFKIDIIIL